MNVHPADTAAGELVTVDELEDLVIVRGRRPWHLPEKTKDLGTSLQSAECQLTQDEWMDENEPLAQKAFQPLVAAAQVIDPNRRVDEDQEGVLRVRRERRLGTPRSLFSEPPSAASLRALSRAIRASRPAWTIAVFSLRPVRLLALSKRASSRISVVLICISMLDEYA